MRSIACSLVLGTAAILWCQAGGAQSFRDPLADGSPGPPMVVIEAAPFMMGSDEKEEGRDTDEGPQIEIADLHDFALGQTEVSVAEFGRFVTATSYETDAATLGCFVWDKELEAGPHVTWDRLPDYASGENYPVVCVSWNDAWRYTQWLGEETGKPYRLPTEAEWEYAARAGSVTSRFWGDEIDQACAYANVLDRAAKKRYPDDRPFHDCDDGYAQAAPIASFAPNRFGLNDMLGNVWEWTCSVHENPYRDQHHVCAPAENRAPRVFRGGAWYIKPSGVRSAHRNAGMPSSQTISIGFRVARDLD